MRNNIACTIVCSLMLAGCSGTSVVLIPDAHGKLGHVTVKTKVGDQELSHWGEATITTVANKRPSQTTIWDTRKIQNVFGAVMSAEPAPPLHYIIAFASGSFELPVDANQILTDTYKAIQTRKSCDVSVIGHSDRVGNNENNRAISLLRAKAVANELKTIGFSQDCMDMRYYGENDPVVATEDEVDEPRNRRVEIEIR